MKTLHYISLTALSIISLVSTSLNAEDHSESINSNSAATYDLFLGKKDIGDYDVQKLVSGTTTQYIATSKAEVNFFGKHKIEYSLKCVFEKGIMQNSEVRTYKNGKPKDVTIIQWDGAQYKINKNGEITFVNEPIYNSTIQLYFEDPNGITKIFSESEAKFKSLTQGENEVYILSDLGEKKGTDYTYESDKLDNIHVNYVVTDFKVIKQ